jgi:hypothetical protein
MHVALQVKPIPPSPVGPSVQTLLQHSSQSAHGLPAGRHTPPPGRQRLTPFSVLRQMALPPLQQFCDAPLPPQTSPSARQLVPPVLGPLLLQRRTPSTSGALQVPEQHSTSEVQTSFTATQPHIG